MEYDKLSYPEAIEKIANESGFSLSYTKDTKSKSDTKILYKVLEFYKKNLFHNNIALEYLQKRGILRHSIEIFELGFAPKSNQTLQFLKDSFLQLDNALKFGILGIGEDNNLYARLIDRITFPIYDQNSNLVGFGGRTITNHPAKYINSPQTPIFNKSRLLYGYNIAKQNIFKKSQIIITEGYLDVIMLHQAGFDNAVATLGTALTSSHLPLIKRGENEVIVAYDGDSAGINAAFKASELLAKNQISGGVVIFKEGLDPADMVANNQANELKRVFASYKPFAEFCLESIVKRYNLNDAIEKDRALNEATAFLNTLSPVVAHSYKGLLAQLLHTNDSFIKLGKKNENKRGSFKTKSEDIAELTLIKSALENDNLLNLLINSVDESMFYTHKESFQELVRGEINSDSLVRIMLREDLKIFDEEEFKRQLCIFIARFYEDRLKELRQDNSTSFKKKSYLIRKYNDIIQNLKRGKLQEAILELNS